MDKATLKLLLIILGVFEIIILAGIIILLWQKDEIPDFLVAASASIITGMLGLAIPHDTSEAVNNALNAVGVTVPAPINPPVAPVNNAPVITPEEHDEVPDPDPVGAGNLL